MYHTYVSLSIYIYIRVCRHMKSAPARLGADDGEERLLLRLQPSRIGRCRKLYIYIYIYEQISVYQ